MYNCILSLYHLDVIILSDSHYNEPCSCIFFYGRHVDNIIILMQVYTVLTPIPESKNVTISYFYCLHLSAYKVEQVYLQRAIKSHETHLLFQLNFCLYMSSIYIKECCDTSPWLSSINEETSFLTSPFYPEDSMIVL